MRDPKVYNQGEGFGEFEDLQANDAIVPLEHAACMVDYGILWI